MSNYQQPNLFTPAPLDPIAYVKQLGQRATLEEIAQACNISLGQASQLLTLAALQGQVFQCGVFAYADTELVGY